MSYDFSGENDRRAPVIGVVKYDPRDLEVVLSTIDISAIFLTDEPGKSFTKEELIAGCIELTPDIHEVDIENVLAHHKYIKKIEGGRYQLR